MQNFYEKIYEIQKDLAESGFNDLGEQLKHVMLEGSTGTEILMALKYSLKAIKKCGLNKSLIKK